MSVFVSIVDMFDTHRSPPICSLVNRAGWALRGQGCSPVGGRASRQAASGSELIDMSIEESAHSRFTA